jgi:hypothetical protein
MSKYPPLTYKSIVEKDPEDTSGHIHSFVAVYGEDFVELTEENMEQFDYWTGLARLVFSLEDHHIFQDLAKIYDKEGLAAFGRRKAFRDVYGQTKMSRVDKIVQQVYK